MRFSNSYSHLANSKRRNVRMGASAGSKFGASRSKRRHNSASRKREYVVRDRARRNSHVTYTRNSSWARLMLCRRSAESLLSINVANRFRTMNWRDHPRAYRIFPVLICSAGLDIDGTLRYLSPPGYASNSHWDADVNVIEFAESTCCSGRIWLDRYRWKKR